MSKESTTPDPEGKLRRHIEAANRCDFDAALAIFSKGAVWDRSPVGQEVIEGRDAIRDFIEDWNAVFEDYVLGLEEFHDVGNGVTFGLFSQRGRPRAGSGLVEEPYAAVVAWMDGLIVRVTVYPDIDEARAAAERLAQERAQADA
jgi:ketosteroid isomerase-like protein